MICLDLLPWVSFTPSLPDCSCCRNHCAAASPVGRWMLVLSRQTADARCRTRSVHRARRSRRRSQLHTQNAISGAVSSLWLQCRTSESERKKHRALPPNIDPPKKEASQRKLKWSTDKPKSGCHRPSVIMRWSLIYSTTWIRVSRLRRRWRFRCAWNSPKPYSAAEHRLQGLMNMNTRKLQHRKYFPVRR
jgi:hypothetical protein